jgi:hypothetical protein
MQTRTTVLRPALIRPAVPRVAGISFICLALILTACGPSAEEPVPTRALAPTFTPTPEVAVAPPVDPAAAAQNQPAGEQPAQALPAANQAQAEPPSPTPLATDTPAPSPTPPQVAQVVASTNMNVRAGPGTNYPIIGAANQGQTFAVKGKNSAGDWWQIDYNGQDGWVFNELVSGQNTQAVAIAVNIPTPPPATNTPIPPPTTPPQPTAPPQPTQPPAPPEPSYEFNKALLQKCAPNEGVTYVEGTTYKNGQPASGYNVAFSYAADGPIVAQTISGPHQGYPGWRTGFYSHILKPDGAREGDWYFWIVDGSGQRISKIAHVHTDGSAGDGKCQQAVIDFDS